MIPDQRKAVNAYTRNKKLEGHRQENSLKKNPAHNT